MLHIKLQKIEWQKLNFKSTKYSMNESWFLRDNI